MADYPSAVTSFPTIVDLVDQVLALHQNERADEIVALQTYIGTNPQGNAASLKARLAHSIDDDGYLNFDSATELTISSDAITITQNAHKLQPQSSTADDLSTINGTVDGDCGVLYVSDFGTDTITIKHNVGNILCVGGADISLSYGCVFWYSNGTKIFVSGGGGSWGTISGTLSSQSDLDKALNMPDGFMKNGKIVVTVVSNDLVVAIKTLAGADPSASDPVYAWINGNKRTITAALSITIPDGTNWFNSGGPELGGQLVPYFVYLAYHSSAVVLTIARKPHYSVVEADMNTTTDESYIYGYSSLSNGDPLENIGYFEATLSLSGTSHLWTVPTFTNVNLKNKPTFQSNRMLFSPQFSANGSMTYTSLTRETEEYQVLPNQCFVNIGAYGITGGTANTSLQCTQPFKSLGAYVMMTVATRDATSGSSSTGVGYVQSSGTAIVRKADVSNYGLGAGRYFLLTGNYFIR